MTTPADATAEVLPSELEKVDTQRFIRRPREDSIFEGNVSELPLWALSDRFAIPRIKVTDSKGVERKVPDPKALTRLVQLPPVTLDDGSVASPTVEIIANQEFGFPTMFAARVLAVILEKAGERPGKWVDSDVVNISRWEIATRLGYKAGSIGKTTYESIEKALEALRSTTLEFRSSWYIRRNGNRANLVKASGLISEFQFYDERRERQATLEVVPPETSRSYVRLSDLLLKSLREGYYHGIDVDYLNALASPLAERLYLYLAKRDGDAKATYQEGLRQLASKLSLQATAPSVILRHIIPALERLKDPLLLTTGTRRQFLKSFMYYKEKELLSVHFFTKKQEVAQIRAALAQGTLPGTL